MAFGEVDTEGIRRYDFWTYIIKLYTLVLITLLMMNILIGIISESVGKVYDGAEKSRYY